MKKITILSLFILAVTAAPSFAEQCDTRALLGLDKNLKDEVFVVETDEDSALDSFNRVSGEIDLGFAAPEQTYQSDNHQTAGPFGRQKAVEDAQKY